MIYLKSALIGLGTVLLGCVVAPIAVLILASWKTETGVVTTVGFSPMFLWHSVAFWALIFVLFAAGFIPSIFLLRK
jgi:hypothetical protein